MKLQEKQAAQQALLDQERAEGALEENVDELAPQVRISKAEYTHLLNAAKAAG